MLSPATVRAASEQPAGGAARGARSGEPETGRRATGPRLTRETLEAEQRDEDAIR